jgi:hypothetical protein
VCVFVCVCVRARVCVCVLVCVVAKQQINTGCTVHRYSEMPVRILRQYGSVQNCLAILPKCQQNFALFECYKFCSALPRVTTDLIRFADCYTAGHSVVGIPLEGI